uniref:Uncharacterized protein n=1 Tax=Amphimedon queenslandica TaxID=400682 RepID=A0A1X7VW57_AMPQE
MHYDKTTDCSQPHPNGSLLLLRTSNTFQVSLLVARCLRSKSSFFWVNCSRGARTAGYFFRLTHTRTDRYQNSSI